MLEKPTERLAQINDESLSVEELSKELSASGPDDLVAQLRALPRAESLQWARKLKKDEFLVYRPQMLKEMDMAFKKADLMKELGATSHDSLLEILSQFGEELSLIWIKRLNFSDYAVLKGQLGGLTFQKKQDAEQAVSGGASQLDGILAGAGLAAGTLGAGAVERMTELMNGSTQTYNANINISDLRLAFESALQNSDIDMDSPSDEDDEGDFVFSGLDGEELLRVQVKNEQEDAEGEKTAYNASKPRKIGKCMIRVTGSNMEALLGKGVTAAGQIGELISRAGQMKDINGLMGALLQGVDRGKNVFEVANLPRMLSVAIEKLAQVAEKKVREQTEEIQKQNRTRLEEVKKGLMCEFCPTPRPDDETENCSGCSAPLSKRGESVGSLKADRARLAAVGLTF